MSELQHITARMEKMGVEKKRFKPLQRDSNKTAREIMSEMFSYLETLKEKEGNMSEEEKAAEKSFFNGWLHSLTPGDEDSIEAAMNDEEEITELEMKTMLSKLRPRSRREFCLFRSTAIYKRYQWKYEQKHYGECARMALALFNERNGTSFVVDMSTCHPNWYLYQARVYYVHLNFKATDDGSKETCMFFAAVRGYTKNDVIVCCKLQSGARKKTRCEFCTPRDGVCHPTDVSLPPLSLRGPHS